MNFRLTVLGWVWHTVEAMRDQPHYMVHNHKPIIDWNISNSRPCIPDCKPDTLSLSTVGLKDTRILSELANLITLAHDQRLVSGLKLRASMLSATRSTRTSVCGRVGIGTVWGMFKVCLLRLVRENRYVLDQLSKSVSVASTDDLNLWSFVIPYHKIDKVLMFP
jgi:hypothetical protein